LIISGVYLHHTHLIAHPLSIRTMSKLNELRKHLKRGQVYRRADLVEWSNAIDRHLAVLVKEGTLQKLAPGLYHCPKESAFGLTPPDEAELIRRFLKDDHFLVTSPNDYNKLGVGTTQLYNKRVVYNHKRHGEFKLGGKNFTFFAKPRFPKKLTDEFLLVDLVNNLDALAEDPDLVRKNVSFKIKSMDIKKLKRSLTDYGTVKAKSLLNSVFKQMDMSHVG
jgi:hypothetical protein